MAVDTTHNLYGKHQRHIKLVRDTLEGGDALRGGGYIPRLPSQEPQEYHAYIHRAPFVNFTDKLLDNLTGLAFAKSPVKDIPQQLENLLHDIDLDKKTDIDLAQNIVQELFITSRIGALVSFTQGGINEPVSGEVAQRYFRPFVKLYPHESIINWKIRNNQTAQVVLMEFVEVDVDEFETAEQEQYLVLDLFEGKYRARRFIKDDNGDYIVIDEVFPTRNGQTLDYIPFFCANPMELSLTPTKPPLYNMAEINIHHFRSNIELGHMLFNMVGFLFGKGINEENATIKIGSTVANFYREENADIKYVALSSDQAKPYENKIKEFEENMGAIGAEFLKNSKQSQISKETLQIQTAGDKASLISVVETASRLMLQVLQEMALWTDENPEDISYQINTDFNLNKLDAQKLKTYAELNQMNIFSDYDIYFKLKEYEEIDKELTYQDWLEYRQNSFSGLDLNLQNDNKEKDERDREEDEHLLNTLRYTLGLASVGSV